MSLGSVMVFGVGIIAMCGMIWGAVAEHRSTRQSLKRRYDGSSINRKGK